MAYNTWKGDAAVGDIVNQDDIDTLIDWENDYISLKTDGTSRLTVSGSNIGIGTTSPDGTLHVMKASAGSVTVTGDQANGIIVEDDDSTSITLLDPSGGVIYFGDAADTDIGRIGYRHGGDYANSMYFWTNNAQQMTIDSAGKVGIGTTSPTSLLTIAGSISGSSTIENVGAVTFGSTLNVTGAVSGAAGTFTTLGGTSLALQSGGITAAGNIAGAGALSGSGTLEMVGPTRLGSTLGVTGSITSKGDLILDDGGSLKEAGGTAAFTYDGSGHVTKIGQDTPSNGQVLTWDTGGTPDRAVWSAAAGGAAGSDTQVQFNDGGSNLGGDGGLTYNKTTDVLSFVNASGSGILQTVGATILGSTLNVSGAVTLAATTSATNITATSLSASANLQSAGPTTLGSTLNVSGAATMAGKVSVDNEISGSGTLQAAGATILGTTLNVSGAVTTRANSIGLKMVADGAISQNDVLTVSGYSGAAFKVKRAHPRDLTSCRGPFYVADTAASDGQELTGVKTKLITGIDTSAYPVGHAVYLDAIDSGSIALTSGSATNHQDLYSFIIPVGRIVSASAAGESLGAYVLDMPAPGRPLVGRVNANTAATNTAVAGFGTEYFHAPVVAMPNQDLGAGPIDDDKQIKTAFIGTGNGGDLRITCDHEMPSEMVFTYIIYI